MTFRRLCILPSFLLMWFALAASAAEDTGQNPSNTPPAAQNSSGGDLKMSRFHVVLGRNLTSNLFIRQNLFPFLIGAAGALTIAPADQEISRSLTNHMHEFGTAGDVLGTVVPATLTGGAFLVGLRTKDDHLRAFGYTLAQAYMTNFFLTQGIKLATDRMRPYGSASNSFPSGHTSSSFAVATVVANYYGKKWGIPFYAFAGLVGLSRIEKGEHWPSDVVAGAALGYICAKTAILGTKRELSGHKTSRMMITPSYGHDWRGVAVYLRY
jgi:membrane-associated phospholipid phosphatase